ncbi:MAG TPA: TIGR03943 family protein [Candidatus Limiplasma sp.]|nr:TIGR03943 family protein [Candidatus Limiplasma sp.]HRX07964.1 TIGR03943 family protein [Candidatus Limiplasma sp.]
MANCGMKILWLVILLALTVVLLTLLLSGDIILYLAPRMVPMVWFGLAVLVVLCVYQGHEIFRCFREKTQTLLPSLRLILFCFPILMMLTAMPDTNTPGSMSNQNVRLLSQVNSGSETIKIEEDSAALETNKASVYLPCILMDERAVFDPQADMFASYLLETAEALQDNTITLYGFVYRDDSFEEDMVLVSRQMITCCAADAAIVGFHVQVNPDIDLQLNEWIRVTGTIKTKNMLYYGTPYTFPVLTNGIILPCNAPTTEYLFINP